MDLPKLKDFVEAFDVPWPIALGVAAGSSVVLHLHDQGLKHFQALPEWSDSVLGLLAIYGFVILAVKLIAAAARGMVSWHHNRRRFSIINERLNSSLSQMATSRYYPK